LYLLMIVHRDDMQNFPQLYQLIVQLLFQVLNFL